MPLDNYSYRFTLRFALFAALCGLLPGADQALPAASDVPAAPSPRTQHTGANQDDKATYILGPDDQLTVWVADADDMNGKPAQVDSSGYVNLPLVGRIEASGLTVRQFEERVSEALRRFYKKPQVVVTVTEARSRPVSVMGAVKTPGVHQLRGSKTLIEILSLAGGLREDAGGVVKITRRAEFGKLPLAGAAPDESGRYFTAAVDLTTITNGADPAANIAVQPYDVVAVPKADMVYVVGEVTKAGSVMLTEKSRISVLQAVAMAGGFTRLAVPQNAKILRPSSDGNGKQEIAVNLKRILGGKDEDLVLRPDDIVYVPDSTSRRVTARVLETMANTVSGVVIWRGGRL